jgi:sugar lactone lactonase YvrE
MSRFWISIALTMGLACGSAGDDGAPPASGADAGPDPVAADVVDRADGDAVHDTVSDAPDARADGGPRRDVVELLAGTGATGWIDGPGVEARFSGPSGGAILPDGSAILVADTFNAVLRRIDLGTREVTTVAGRVQVQATADGVGTAARFQSPRAMIVDRAGRTLYLADGPTIRKVTLPEYTVTTIAGTPGAPGYVDGKGAEARLGFLLHAFELSADEQTLFVADRSNRVLRTVELATGTIRTVAGTRYNGAEIHTDGIGAAARFSGLGGLARIRNELFVADTFNHVIRKIDLSTFAVTTFAGKPQQPGLDDGARGVATFSSPQGLAVKGAHLYTTSFDGVLRRIALADAEVETIAGDPDDARPVDGAFASARLGLGFAAPMPDPKQDAIWYQDRSASSIRRIDLADGKVETIAGSKDPQGTVDGNLRDARFDTPNGLAASADGRVFYVADALSHLIRRIDVAAGIVETVAGRPSDVGGEDGEFSRATFSAPSALAWDEDGGVVYVVDGDDVVIRALDLRSKTVRTLTGRSGEPGTADGPVAAARWIAPAALALDPTGQRLFVTESVGRSAEVPKGRAAIRVIDLRAGTVTTLVGGDRAASPLDGPFATASLETPRAIAFDPLDERLFVAETGRSTIRVADLKAKTLTVYAGKDGERGPADGALDRARFHSPGGLIFSSGARSLFVTDGGAHTIRRIDVVAKTVSTWLGDPSRNGGLAPGRTFAFAEATLYQPSAPVIAGGDLAFLSEHGVYVARPSQALSR